MEIAVNDIISNLQFHQLEIAMIEFSLEVDASGLHCPLPLLRLKKGLMEVQQGEVVKVIATDPAVHLDIGVFVDQSGHELVHFSREQEVQIFFIKKK